MAENDKTPSKPSEKSNKKLIIIISVIAVVIIAILVGVIIWLMSGEESSRPQALENTGGRGTVITDENADEIINEPSDDSSYTTEQRSSWYFPSGAEASPNSYVRNNERNTNPVYFNINLRDDAQSVEEKDLVYESPIMEVGQSVTNVKLNKRLEPGDYNAILTYHIIQFTDDSKENYEELRTVSTGITLHIQS